MGLFDKIRGEFIDIVEWLDDSRDTIVYRFPRYDNEIKMGAKLVVRESQSAVFVNEGKLADVFGPGTTSTSGITCAGLSQCATRKRSGSPRLCMRGSISSTGGPTTRAKTPISTRAAVDLRAVRQTATSSNQQRGGLRSAPLLGNLPMMTPANTPLDEWLTIWVFHEVEAICDEKGIAPPFTYSGMSSEQRAKKGLPVNRKQAISFIRQHRGNKYD